MLKIKPYNIKLESVLLCPVSPVCVSKFSFKLVLLQVDVFAFGIVLCEIIARIQADPDILPRTEVRRLLSSRRQSPYRHKLISG